MTVALGLSRRAEGVRGVRGVRAADLLALTKPGITQLVVVTAAAGFFLGSAGPTAWARLLHALAGTALVAGGTNALNQWWERDSDALMRRTRSRPIAARRLKAATAFGFAWTIALLGIGYLALATNALTAALAAATLLSYVLVYTPLKRRTPLALVIGAVPGALPILGGWTAAGAPLGATAFMLFAVLFLWQLPHFLALAWLYRDDYRRAGLATAGGRDDTGRPTARLAALATVALVAASMAPPLVRLGGVPYLACGLVAGVWFARRALAFVRRPDEPRARGLFIASVAYLPLLLGALVIGYLFG